MNKIELAVMNNIQTSANLHDLENQQNTHEYDDNTMEINLRPKSSTRIIPNNPLEITSVSSLISEREMIMNSQVTEEPKSLKIANNISVTASGHELRRNNWTVDDSNTRGSFPSVIPIDNIGSRNITDNENVNIPSSCTRLCGSKSQNQVSNVGPLTIVFITLLLIAYFYRDYPSSSKVFYATAVFTDCLLISWPIYWVESSGEISGYIRLKVSQIRSDFGHYN